MMRSLIGTLLIWLSMVYSFGQASISSMEYYIDTDPGVGSGTSIAITSGVTQDIDVSINTSSLSIGFHQLVIRSLDDTGDWGIHESRVFYVSSSNVTSTSDIAAMEYFFDTDPGFGSATAISVTEDATVDIAELISTSSLSVGFHQLVVRSQDVNGVWGVNESRVVYVSASDVTAVSDIAAMEYFFDTDPGFGGGTAISLTQASPLDVDEMISTASLSNGFHELIIRAQDANGVWGIQESRVVYVSASNVGATSEIAAIEYFFDTDPGFGNGTAIAITQATSIDLGEMIATSSLSTGFHVLVVRAQDANGVWGIQEKRSFYASTSSVTSVNEITDIEYFFDTDPGYGNGTPVAITSSPVIDIDAIIASSALPEGAHVLVVRARDDQGVWGMQKSKVFFNRSEELSSPSPITGVEYFIDTDPGIGTATEIAISPSQPTIDQDFTVPTASLGSGTYSLGVRVSNEDDKYSLTSISAFTICESPTADFVATTVCVGSATDFTDLSIVETGDVYSWDFDGDGNEDANSAGDVSFTYPTAGIYTASLTIDRSGCTDQSTITVDVEEIPVANAGEDQVISVVETTMDATPASEGEVGSWTLVSGTANITSSSDPQTSVTAIGSMEVVLMWTVVNEAAGCLDEDEVTITYNEPLSEETDILTFTLAELTDAAVISTTEHTVSASVASGTDLTALTPTITVSEGATISPASGAEQSFASPVLYTVTAEDGLTTQDWTVIVTEEPSDETDILTFVLAELTKAAVISIAEHTVSAEVARGTDLTALIPTITVSEGAEIDPSSDVEQSFASPVVYTVTAEDGLTTQDWTVTVTEEPRDEAEILSFSLNEQLGEAIINSTAGTIFMIVEFGTGLSGLDPAITVSEGATIDPSGAQDFTSPVLYTVTAEDGITTKEWTAVIEEKPLSIGDGEISIFPNPAHDIVFISGMKERFYFELIDMSGRVLLRGNDGREISLVNLPSGSYTLRIETDEFRLDKRIIKY